jgi:prepilin-type processing-associated H-X9-DG protein
VNLPIPATANQATVYANSTAVLAGLQFCTQRFTARNSVLDDARGKFWANGNTAQSVFNTVSVPNSPTEPWSTCSTGVAGSSTFNNANSYHPAGVNVAFADGSVRCIKSTISQTVWWALGTRANSEVISADAY